MSDQEPVDSTAMLRLSVIRLILANNFDDCEIIKCLDTKTGDTCNVLFLPAMDPDDGDVYMTPAFAIPESDISEQESRYLPVDTLPRTNLTNFKNN